MEHIFIYDRDDKIILNLEDNIISGFTFHSDNTYEPIDKSVFKYFDFLKLSNNRQILPYENNYLVILDKDTNYKHYFRNGIEDFRMFFLNNGKDARFYSKEGEDSEEENEESEVKEYTGGAAVVVLSILATCLIGAVTSLGLAIREEYLNNRDITLQEMHNLIYSSQYLSDEEKDYLYNEDLFEYILPYINKSSSAKYLYRNVKYKDFDIEFYEQDKYPNWGGFYEKDNKIHVSEENVEAMPHEACHVLQSGKNEYRLLTEAFADLIAHEFYGKEIDSLDSCIILTKKLIETLGVESFITYNAIGEDELIREKISSYLDEEECDRFIFCMKEKVTRPSGNCSDVTETNRKLRKELTGLVEKLANKMGIIFNDEEIVLGKKKYFNQKEVNEKYPNYIKKLKLLSKLKDGNYELKEFLNSGIVKFLKVDNEGNFIGEATYDELTNRWRHFNVVAVPNSELCNFTALRFGIYDDINISVVKTYQQPVYSYTTYDEYASKDSEEDQDITYTDFYKNLEVPKFDKEKYLIPYEYLDGSTVQILEDDTVIKREVDGTEKTYTVATGAKLIVHDNGLICWQGKSGIIYRVIFPDGTLLEKIIVNEPDNLFSYDTQYKYETSTGESLMISNGSICSYTTKDGDYYMPLDYCAFFNFYDKDSNVLGIKKYISENAIVWYDNDGNQIMYADFNDDINVWTIDKKEDGSSIDTDKNGVKEYWDSEGDVVKICYPNGYVVSIDHEKYVSKFYNDKGELIAVKNGICITEENGMLFIETGDRNDKTFDAIYFGKYEVFTDENNNKTVTILGNDLIEEENIPKL